MANAVIARSEDWFEWPACEFGIPRVCGGTGEQIHHRKLRSQGGGHTVPGCVYICHDCHDYLHGHTAESYDNGWIVHWWDDPAVEPVLRRGRWVWLNEDGTVIEC